MLRHLIILSGNVVDTPLLRYLMRDSSYIIAADGGADHAHRLGVIPDLAVGDLDSIQPEGLAWLEARQIPLNIFPVEKNATDSEIALAAAIASVPEGTPPTEVELVFIGAMGTRPDHVLGNQLIAACLATKGYRVLLTDGISILQAAHGPFQQTFNLAVLPPTTWAFSTIALTPQITGLTYEGLKYPLENYTIEFGSTRGISNEPKPDSSEIHVSFTQGLALICLTPKV
ncbi:MAG: thiamine diphosphokinase [Ruminococcaceae bacterium]|nr:thiamine diphosphokinase [Oscillospiraceae bacterium]